MGKTITDTFTASEVAALTGMNVDTLRVWRRRGYFSLTGEGSGWTRFTFGDVLKIATFNQMLDNFFTHDAAEVVTANCTAQFAKILGGTEETPPPYLVFGRGADGDVLFEIVDGIENLGRQIVAISARAGEKHATLHVVDYASILSRVMIRLREVNERSRPLRDAVAATNARRASEPEA